MQAIVSACLASVIIICIILSLYAANIKKDFKNTMRSVVDQVNSSNYYQYELEKRSYDKLNGVDTNIQNVRSKYVPRDELANKLDTKTVYTKDIQQHDGTAFIGGNLDFGNDMKIKGVNKTLEVNLPGTTSMNIKNGANKDIMNFNGDTATSMNLKTDKLKLGNKFTLSGVGDAHGNDTWLRFFDKDGKDFYGGVATANLWNRDNAYLAGTTNITGLANINKMIVKGGASEHNQANLPTQLAHTDNKNYIRGDTELIGNIKTAGDLNVGRDLDIKRNTNINTAKMNSVKVGHNWSTNAAFSAYPQTALMGREFTSLLPSGDGNTYIRPGVSGGQVFLGDIGNTSSVNIGDQNTVTKVRGSLCIQDTCISKTDLDNILSVVNRPLKEAPPPQNNQLVEPEPTEWLNPRLLTGVDNGPVTFKLKNNILTGTIPANINQALGLFTLSAIPTNKAAVYDGVCDNQPVFNSIFNFSGTDVGATFTISYLNQYGKNVWTRVK